MQTIYPRAGAYKQLMEYFCGFSNESNLPAMKWWAGDVSDCIMRSAARLNLQVHGVARAIALQQWDLSQPPMQASGCANPLAMLWGHRQWL